MEDSRGPGLVRVCVMRTGITVEVSARLEAIVADRNSPQKHVWRAGEAVYHLRAQEGYGVVGRVMSDL
jgi:hypothetical protein